MNFKMIQIAFNWVIVILYFVFACIVFIPIAILLAFFSGGFIDLILDKVRLLIKHFPKRLIPKRNK
jgi:hypothetical protein